MAYGIERQTAIDLVHREHVAKILSRTGGEIIHPDHYDLREAIRNAVLEAIDEATSTNGFPLMSDAELPRLFAALDQISERVFLKRAGL